MIMAGLNHSSYDSEMALALAEEVCRQAMTVQILILQVHSLEDRFQPMPQMIESTLVAIHQHLAQIQIGVDLIGSELPLRLP